MSRERLLSVMAGRASLIVGRKKPSRLIPFRGNFPLLEDYEITPYLEAIQSTENLEDLSPRFQRATILGNRIGIMEEGFTDYLYDHGISEDDFLEMNNSDKSDLLIHWMSKDCIDYSQLTIK